MVRLLENKVTKRRRGHSGRMSLDGKVCPRVDGANALVTSQTARSDRDSDESTSILVEGLEVSPNNFATDWSAQLRNEEMMLNDDHTSGSDPCKLSTNNIFTIKSHCSAHHWPPEPNPTMLALGSSKPPFFLPTTPIPLSKETAKTAAINGNIEGPLLCPAPDKKWMVNNPLPFGNDKSSQPQIQSTGAECHVPPRRQTHALSVGAEHQLPRRCQGDGRPPCSPGPNDVLFGRGGAHKRHPGNRRMQLLADIHRDAYNLAERDDKTDITWDIVRIIKAAGGRFLKRPKLKDHWEEVSIRVAREKVSHAMRDGRTKPMGAIDMQEVNRLPLLSESIRATAARMASLHQQGAPHAFGEEEAEILKSLLA